MPYGSVPLCGQSSCRSGGQWWALGDHLQIRGGGEIRLMWLAVSMSLMVIKRWHCMATFSACPPFSDGLLLSTLISPSHASPRADPQDHNLLQLLLDFFCDLLPQVWKETLSAGVGRLVRPSLGWSERGHCVSEAETREAQHYKGL